MWSRFWNHRQLMTSYYSKVDIQLEIGYPLPLWNYSFLVEGPLQASKPFPKWNLQGKVRILRMNGQKMWNLHVNMAECTPYPSTSSSNLKETCQQQKVQAFPTVRPVWKVDTWELLTQRKNILTHQEYPLQNLCCKDQNQYFGFSINICWTTREGISTGSFFRGGSFVAQLLKLRLYRRGSAGKNWAGSPKRKQKEAKKREFAV